LTNIFQRGRSTTNQNLFQVVGLQDASSRESDLWVRDECFSVPQNMVIRCSPDITDVSVIELDDGTILTGKPNQFDGKNPWVSG